MPLAEGCAGIVVKRRSRVSNHRSSVSLREAPAFAGNVRDDMIAALRKFPAPVTVVALRRENGDFFATTATAVTVLTMDPPTMIACINRNSVIARELERGCDFSINLLRACQQEIARACAGGLPHEERERVSEWTSGAGGVPVLSTAQVAITCRNTQFMVHGTHDLLIGEVLGVDIGDGLESLLYVNRTFGSFAAAS